MNNLRASEQGHSKAEIVGQQMRHHRIALIATALFFATNAAASDDRQDMLGPENWPTTVEDTVRDLLPRLSMAEKLRIKLTTEENIISLYFDLGVGIRNRYGLWRGNDKLIFSACRSLCHPDEASMKIIAAVWQELHK
jgi:hypothetical protein